MITLKCIDQGLNDDNYQKLVTSLLELVYKNKLLSALDEIVCAIYYKKGKGYAEIFNMYQQNLSDERLQAMLNECFHTSIVHSVTLCISELEDLRKKYESKLKAEIIIEDNTDSITHKCLVKLGTMLKDAIVYRTINQDVDKLGNDKVYFQIILPRKFNTSAEYADKQSDYVNLKKFFAHSIDVVFNRHDFRGNPFKAAKCYFIGSHDGFFKRIRLFLYLYFKSSMGLSFIDSLLLNCFSHEVIALFYYNVLTYYAENNLPQIPFIQMNDLKDIVREYMEDEQHKCKRSQYYTIAFSNTL